MNFFVVFQNKTFDRESKEGILWAPQKNKSGREIFHWSNMKKVKPGDIVFSILKNFIASVNIATSGCYDSKMPGEFSEHGWDKEGWQVDLEYNPLTDQMKITDIIDNLYPFLNTHKSPFQINGRGNQGYLFELPQIAGDYLIDLLNIDKDIINTSDSEIDEITKEFKEVEDLNLVGLDKEAVVKIRVGHGKFKKRLLREQGSCQICGLDLKELLISSHIKAWSKSDEFEKVDINNGLILCPNHDSLFDRGLISFSDDGKLLVSSLVDLITKEKLGLTENINLKMNNKRKAYMSWHKENLFIE